MKTKKLILGSFLALTGLTIAQNTFPSSGYAGIGTLSPSEMLDVLVSSSSGGIQVRNNTTNSSYIRLKTSGTGFGDFMVGATGSSQIEGNGSFVIHDATVSKTRLIIKPSGNIGIGTLTPDLMNDYSRVFSNYDVTPLGQGIYYYGVKGKVQSVSAIPGAGAYQTMIGVAGISSSGYSDEGFATGVVGIASNSRWNFGGDFSASGNGAYDNVGVHGTASGNSNSSKNWACRFDGQTYCTSGAWNSSDRKLKENIQPLTNALEKIKQLKPSTYNYKTDAELKDLQLPGEKQMGFVAQELEEVFPELVREITPLTKTNEKGEKTFNTPGFKAVQYTSLIPVLIAGIQEQQKQIEGQKELIEQLSQKLSGSTGLNTINTVETGFQMSQNEPNPFTHETVVKYTLPQTISNAFMAVYDLTGKQITTFQINEKGSSSITITSEKLAAGIYIYSIVADGKVVDSKRMIVAEK